MHCPACQRTDVDRSHRSGAIDQLMTWCGQWPYRCRSCNHRFFNGVRQVPAPPEPELHRAPAGPSTMFRKQPTEPTAHIVVKADTHEQLDTILLALHNAIAAHEVRHDHEPARK